jgi:hypothetical protein
MNDPDYVTMFSWKPVGQSWHFALVRGDKRFTHYTIEQIADYLRGSPGTANGIKILEQQLLLFSGDREIPIFWERFTSAGLIYPPAPQVDRILAFAKRHKIRLELDPTQQ